MSSVHKREIEIGGKWGLIRLQSLIGPTDEIAGVVAEHIKGGMQPTAIICFGISDDGQNAIVIFCKSAKDTVSLASLNAIITKIQANHLLVAGFHFASFISILKCGIVVAAFDDGFKPDEKSGAAIQSFIDVIFYEKSGELHSSASSTILLLSRPDKRALCAKQNTITGPFIQIKTPNDGETQVFGIISGDIVVSAAVGSNSISAIHAEDLNDLFETGVVPKWSQRTISVGQIEDISLPVDDASTVILTACDIGRRKLIPTVIDWNRKGFQIVLHTGDSVVEIGRTVPAPLRVDAQTGFVAARQNNGGPDRLQITTIDQFAGGIREFADMVEKATTGGFVSAIAA